MLQSGEVPPAEAAWLLLLHQLPARPSSLRVRVWRRLQAVGALPLRSAAYVLPNRPEPREDLAWVAADVRALGGEATVLACATLDEADERELEAAFRAARASDYRALAKAAAGLYARFEREQPPSPALVREEARLRAEADRLARITYFDPMEREEAHAMLERLKSRLHSPPARARTTATAKRGGSFRGRTWVTRPRPGIDRMASAWLIRAHVDPRARFAFAERPVADAIPFDMYQGEFSHQAGACTFEVLARRFEVSDPAVAWLGRVVHDVDLREERYAEPEAAGIALMVEGLRARHGDDDALLEAGIELFAALARGRQSSHPKPRRPKPGARRARPRGPGR
jgi:hypothetical protein